MRWITSGQFVRQTLDIFLSPPLDHHARQRFGARIAKQEASLPVERGFNPARGLGNLRDLRKRSFLANAHVDKHLRVAREARAQRFERLARLLHRAQEEKRRDHPVARSSRREDDVARLLAAETAAAADELFEDVLVADRRARDRDAVLAQRELEPDVAHHGRDDLPAVELGA